MRFAKRGLNEGGWNKGFQHTIVEKGVEDKYPDLDGTEWHDTEEWYPMKKRFGGLDYLSQRMGKRGGLPMAPFMGKRGGLDFAPFMGKRVGLDFAPFMGKRPDLEYFAQRMGRTTRGGLDYLSQRMGKRSNGYYWKRAPVRFGKRIPRFGKRIPYRMGKRLAIPWHHKARRQDRLGKTYEKRTPGPYGDYPFMQGKRDPALYRLIKRTPYRIIKRSVYPISWVMNNDKAITLNTE